MPSKHTSTVNIDPSEPRFSHLKQAMEEISKQQNNKTVHVFSAIQADIQKHKINAQVSEVLLETYQVGLRKIAKGEVILNPIAWLRKASRKVIKNWKKG